MLDSLLEERGIIPGCFAELDELKDRFSFEYDNQQFFTPAKKTLESEGTVLPGGTILHFEWNCWGVEKVVRVGTVAPEMNPVDAARKMHFGLARQA